MESYARVCPICQLGVQVNQAQQFNNGFPHKGISPTYDPAFKFPGRGFTFFHLNTRSLFQKIDEIRLFAKENPFQVLVFSETWFHNDIANSEISIEGYSNPIRCDRQYGEHHAGGLAVYLKNSVIRNEIKTTSCENLEAVAIRVSPCSSPTFI